MIVTYLYLLIYTLHINKKSRPAIPEASYSIPPMIVIFEKDNPKPTLNLLTPGKTVYKFKPKSYSFVKNFYKRGLTGLS